jgi:iron ABC transporter, ATP-binding protein
MVTLAFREVGQTFGDLTVFSRLSCTIAGGKVTAVTGGNGSGKSTFLRIAARLLCPTAGMVETRADGALLSALAYQRHLAMVTPEMKLYPRLTARENMAFFLGLRGRILHEADYEALLSRVGLRAAVLQEKGVGALSTGMAQRLKIAVLLGCEADVWLLDEPGANLDEAGRRMVRKEMTRGVAEGRLVLLATNDAGEEAEADEVIHLGADGAGAS